MVIKKSYAICVKSPNAPPFQTTAFLFELLLTAYHIEIGKFAFFTALSSEILKGSLRGEDIDSNGD